MYLQASSFQFDADTEPTNGRYLCSPEPRSIGKCRRPWRPLAPEPARNGAAIASTWALIAMSSAKSAVRNARAWPTNSAGTRSFASGMLSSPRSVPLSVETCLTAISRAASSTSVWGSCQPRPHPPRLPMPRDRAPLRRRQPPPRVPASRCARGRQRRAAPAAPRPRRARPMPFGLGEAPGGRRQQRRRAHAALSSR
jgi:hypothetical protein